MNDTYVYSKDAARMLNVPTRTIRSWIMKGLVEAEKIPTGGSRFVYIVPKREVYRVGKELSKKGRLE